MVSIFRFPVSSLYSLPTQGLSRVAARVPLRYASSSVHSPATAANGTDLPLSAYRARLHVPEAYSTAQPYVLLAASPSLGVGCWPTKPQPSILFSFFKGHLFTGYRFRYALWSGRYVRFLSAKLEVARQTPSRHCVLT